MEGNLRFKIDWASLIVGSKLPFFVFEGNFQVQVPGGLIFGRAIHGGGYFRNLAVLNLSQLLIRSEHST